MKDASRVLLAGLLAGCLILVLPPRAEAQFADAEDAAPAAAGDAADAGEASTLLSAEDLNALVAPVALYPDELLAVVLPAATNPLQIVEAQRFLDQRASDPNLQPDQNWDPAVLALINYPEVVKQMNDDLGWTQDLGNAVLDQQDDVLNAIQTARGAASEAGYLQSNDQQNVTVSDNDKIVIESAQPEVIYVPTYDPAPIVNNTYVEYPPPVYSEPYPPYYAPGATFFAGAMVGAAFAYGFDWDDNDIDIDCCDGGGDINNNVNIDRGDVNIGSGNTNIDKTKLQNKFNGDRKTADGKMKWSSQKARTNSSVKRKPQAAARPTSAGIQQKLSGGGAAKPAAANRVKPQKSVQKQSQRGQASLNQTKQPKQQLRQNANQKQQVKRQQQKPQKQLQQKQLKQKQGAFKQMPSQKQVKSQSNRGNRSMKSSGQAKPRPKRR